MLVLRQLADFAGAVGIPAHDGEGLFIALFSEAKRPRDLWFITAAGQMYTPKALDSDDLPRLQGIARKLDGVASHALSVFIEIENLRPTFGAAVRLRVIAAVFDIVVLPFAVRAHREGRHGGFGPVVGYIPDDGKARAAVSTIDEGIAVAPVCGISELAQAVIADADIGRDKRVAQKLGFAVENTKLGIAPELVGVFDRELLDDRELRRAPGQLLSEALQRLALSLKLQLHAGGGVFDIAE